jgi:hypothetical protein
VDGTIFYYGSTTAYTQGSSLTLTSAYFWLQSNQSANIVNYSLNGADHLTQKSWVYLVGIPQANPMLYRLDPGGVTSWYTTELPDAEDGKVYIKLGFYSDGTIFSLYENHPAYWFKDGALRPYLTRDYSTSPP